MDFFYTKCQLCSVKSVAIVSTQLFIKGFLLFFSKAYNFSSLFLGKEVAPGSFIVNRSFFRTGGIAPFPLDDNGVQSI